MSIRFQKIFGGISLACLGLALVGFSVDFLTELAVARYLYPFVFLVFISLNALAIIGMSKNDKGSLGIKLLCLPGFAIVSSVFIYSALVIAVPYLLHKIKGESAAINYVVTQKPNSYLDRHCSGALYVERGVYFNSRLCGVPKRVWLETEIGSVVRVKGRKSMFGFSYKPESVEQLTSQSTRTW